MCCKKIICVAPGVDDLNSDDLKIFGFPEGINFVVARCTCIFIMRADDTFERSWYLFNQL